MKNLKLGQLNRNSYDACPVLLTEPSEDFLKLKEQLFNEIQPVGPIETHYVKTVASLIWEINRWRRNKTEIIRANYKEALYNLLMRLLSPEIALIRILEIRSIAEDWVCDPGARDKALEMLMHHNLDEAAIEAEAMRLCMDTLERLDRLQASSEARLHKTLRAIDNYRRAFGARVREQVEKALAGSDQMVVDDRVTTAPE